jgi:hypothetical protein
MQTSLIQAFKTHLVNELHFNSKLFYTKIDITSATRSGNSVILALSTPISDATFTNQQIAISGIKFANTITAITLNSNIFTITVEKHARITLDDKTITLGGFVNTAWNTTFEVVDIRSCNDYTIKVKSQGLSIPAVFGYLKQEDSNNVFNGNKVASFYNGSQTALIYPITNDTIQDGQIPNIIIESAYIKFNWQITMGLESDDYLDNFFSANASKPHLLCTFGNTSFVKNNGEALDDNVQEIYGNGSCFNIKENSTIKFYAIFPITEADFVKPDKIVFMELGDALKYSLIKTLVRKVDISVTDTNGFKRKIKSIKPLSSSFERFNKAYIVYSYTFKYSVDVTNDMYNTRATVVPLKTIYTNYINEGNGEILKTAQNNF